MIGRLLVVAGGIAVGAATAAAAWTRRKTMPGAGTKARERGLTPLPPEPETQATAAAEPAGTAEHQADSDTPDDLQAVKGIGDVSEERLAEAGVTTLAQIAGWSDDDLETIAAAIKVSPERIRREDWVGQAKAAAEARE